MRPNSSTLASIWMLYIGVMSYMYFVIDGGAHARCEDSASWGCIGRAINLFVLKSGSGSGESALRSVDCTSASMMVGCAGVGCAAMLGEDFGEI